MRFADDAHSSNPEDSDMVRPTVLRAALVAAATAATLSATPAAAKTFRWASASDIPTWDIHSQNNALGNGVHAAVSESLFYYNRKFELEPMLATGFKQISPTQVKNVDMYYRADNRIDMRSVKVD
jgi:peptide/nickel transport system substrate-binding protein